MFDSLLIANRGEIACRIIRSARAMGLRCVAVYSRADAAARHVELADDAYEIGPAEAAQSYLKIDALLDVARRSGAQAVHPGYGFLSESADFAEACAGAGIVFVGPPATAIRAMGSKSEAKALMARAGVPLVPGYHGVEQDPQRLAAAAEEIGYPVLIKASAGGGGKGMRQVADAKDFASALASAKREALSAFGDDRVLVEKWLERPRHIEVQVFADQHGNVVHLFERDCSLQRRHQKVVEEAPAPGLSPDQREEMGGAAVAAASAIGYVGAGTVEFIAQGDSFYFMEMNTRLQVEHPVTEMITGQDLVAWQLKVAAGEDLPLRQEALRISGHAVEARLYAEDPQKGFLPSTGPLLHYRMPEETPQLRIDSGVGPGDSISPFYDPMIAKLVVWGLDRDDALRRLEQALCAVEILGPATNVAFLVQLVRSADYRAGPVDTGFIERQTWSAAAEPSDRVLALACLAELLGRASDAQAAAADSHDPYSPWALSNGWRLNVDAQEVLTLRHNERDIDITVGHRRSGRYRLSLPGGTLDVGGQMVGKGRLAAVLDNHRVTLSVVRRRGELVLFYDGELHRLRLQDPHQLGDLEETSGGSLAAPMPGKVVAVLVEAGQDVERGARLMLLEAMKMEHAVVAPAAGTVTEIHFTAGDLVDEGIELMRIEPAEGG